MYTFVYNGGYRVLKNFSWEIGRVFTYRSKLFGYIHYIHIEIMIYLYGYIHDLFIISIWIYS